MDENESMTFTILDDDGVEVTCDVIFTFQSEETGKNYIVYTDNTTDEEGNTKVYASIYDPTAEESRLDPIETEEEWAMIQHILEQLQQEILDERELPREMGWPTPKTEEDNILPIERPEQ